MITDRRSIVAGLALIAAAVPMAVAQATRSAPAARRRADELRRREDRAAILHGRARARGAVAFDLAARRAKRRREKGAHEFAGFELGEAITVNMVLKDLGATAPAMTAKGTAIDRQEQ